MEIKIAYGKTGLNINLEDDWDITVVEPKYIDALTEPGRTISDSLKNPINSLPLKELVMPHYKIGIIFSDITRPMPRKIILQTIFDELDMLSPDNITLFNSLGTHRENTREELIEMLGEEIFKKYRIVQNNFDNKTTQKFLGVSSRGHEIWLNKEMAECDFLILTGFIEPHFFAGYSGGGKAIMPGMAGEETILGNHDAKMISNPNSTWGITEGNPIWEEVNEVSEKIEKKFLVNVTLNRDKEITGVFSGELKEAHKRGCEFVKNSSMIPVNNEFDIVVTSNSGYPLDLNLYQTIKGVSAAAKIVKNGGAIIIASDCWDGIPDHGLFGKLLSEADSPLSLLEDILNSDFPRQDQWQAQIQTQIQQKADVYLYTENLTEKQIFDSLLIPSKSIENTIREIMSRRSDKLKICVLPEGPQTIAYID